MQQRIDANMRTAVANCAIMVYVGNEARLTTTRWQSYAAWTTAKGGRDTHSVAGDVRVLRDFASPELHNRHDILVYLPPSYRHSSGRYPVIYMHDGQNLFDAATSYAGEWRVDETM